MEISKMTRLLTLVKEKKPLIHHMTNVVTINDCANVTLAIGASPVMATEMKEVEEMIHLADALIINLGTIHDLVFESMLHAGIAANKKGIPVVLDPVGVGATTYRTERSMELLEKVKMAIIRGNSSEIHTLIGGTGGTKGVDAGEGSVPSIEIAQQAANAFQCVVGISGKVDVVSNGSKNYFLSNGDEKLTRITGTGCMSTSLIGSISAVASDHLEAAITGMSIMSLSGERATQHLEINEGIGTYKLKLMDEIFRMNEEILAKEVQIREC
ncbi:hydroxyethylthiazole kinase [Heyndrickxia vini]|uniref:Hydroxyethylthiazole kinase n=1 Tax=Heyndrickxia vini TaxID=1476025 RepID=A0ABX7E7L9_9BACI|nr:hydroxyethylthiazole kinase [Heyndrickxia vini]QQZ11299.1 hydroxyethylthiazole kinase [Heyndrickxia vini]